MEKKEKKEKKGKFQFPIERLFSDTDLLMRTEMKISKRSARERVAAPLLAAATVAVKGRFNKDHFFRGAQAAWRMAGGPEE